MAGFDPTHAVRFDLPRGSVIAGGEERHVLLPCSALDDLVLIAGPDAAAAVGRALGTSIGKRMAVRLGGPRGLRGSTLEEVVSHMAGELAVIGLGAASMERWGRALVVAIERPAVSDLSFLAAIVEGMLEGAASASVRTTPLGREGALVRILVAGDAAVTRARRMLDEGRAWGEVLARLQPKGGGA
ncbi:MAG TPA: hypothetical protein VGI39_09805 [Polyangiaceae bacterium]|jgi:hypothetical protein